MSRTLYVIAVCSNPIRFGSRTRLFRDFRQRIEATPGAQLIAVEQAFGDRPFEVTKLEDRFDCQVRAGAESEVWVKESLINIGFRHLSGQVPDWRYAAWVDGDIAFGNEGWANETVELLQHYRVVQPWTSALDLGPRGEPIAQHESFARSYWCQPSLVKSVRGYFHPGAGPRGVNLWHPGFAWAIRRATYDAIGGLLDWLPMGSGDFFMAHAFVDNLVHALASKVGTAAYRRKLLQWGERAAKHVQCDVGHVDGLLTHHWHGKKRERYYVQRDQALQASKFNPDLDVTHNAQGLLVLTGHNRKLREALRRYLRSRNEDSIDA